MPGGNFKPKIRPWNDVSQWLNFLRFDQITERGTICNGFRDSLMNIMENKKLPSLLDFKVHKNFKLLEEMLTL